MAQQVKFYSTTVASFSALGENKDPAGVYFVDGGELYKGAQRFGLGRVTVAASTDGVTGAERGDIVVTGSGAGWVYVDSTTGWKPIGGDTSALQSAWQTDISTWTAGLVAGGNGSYITGITQGADGKVTASAAAFPTLNLASHTESSTVNGITVSVTTESGAVTGVSLVNPFVATASSVTGSDCGVYVTVSTKNGQVTGVGVSADDISCSTVTANSAEFTDLTVTDTATFSATTVSATTLTVGGVAVNNIAASSATGGTKGVAVTVSTANGGVTDVGVAITSASLLSTLDLTDFAGKDVVTAIGPSSGTGAATDNQVPTALAVAKKLATLDNAMHFREVVASTGAIADPAKGDIVVIGATPATGFVEGQEYIYDGTKWELIGDQKTYAVNAYSNASISTYAGVTTVPGALDAVGAAADTFQAALDAKVTGGSEVSDASKGTNLVTAGAVANYVDLEIAALSLGTAAKKNYADSLKSTGTSLPTESAVASYVTTQISALDSSVSSTENSALKVGVQQVDGKVTTVTAEFVWLDASGSVIS